MTEAKLNDAKSVLAFMFAGNAIFTLRSLRTGARFTYKIQKNDRADNFFARVLAGPDNTRDYVYIGMIINGAFKTTAKSKMHRGSLPVDALSWALGQFQKDVLPELVEVWHVGRCGRCGRMLTVPESVASGIGPDCAAQMGVNRITLTTVCETPEAKEERLAMESPREKTFREVCADMKPMLSEKLNQLAHSVNTRVAKTVDHELARLVAEAVEEYKRTQPENYQDGMLDEEEARAVATNKFRKEMEQDDRYQGSKFGEYEREQEEAVYEREAERNL